MIVPQAGVKTLVPRHVHIVDMGGHADDLQEVHIRTFVPEGSLGKVVAYNPDDVCVEFKRDGLTFDTDYRHDEVRAV